MGNDQKIEVEIDVTAEDYRRVLFWYFWKRILLVALLYLIIIPASIWFVAFGAGANPLEIQNRQLLIVFVFFGMLPILLVFGRYFSIWRQAKKIENISEKSLFIFSDNGLETKSKSTSSQMLWERFAKIYETKTDFIFFPQEHVFYTIPKRFFINQNEMQDLRELVGRKLGEKAKLQN
jgi:YcxB-like protein